MLRKIESLGDRLLARFLPKVDVAAAYCWTDYCTPTSPCLKRTCCINGYCTNCRLC
jgi:hypothetical protein